LFAIIGANLKLNAPFAQTFLQVIRVRWGKPMHCLYVAYSLGTNVLVSSMLVLGGAETVNALTGMPTLAAAFITPAGIACYVLIGGLRSSFVADYTHTAVLVAIILAFGFNVYGTSDKIGSFSKMAQLLESATPVEGNAKGSYLTMRSQNGLIFGIINICGNFATVFLDQSYAQRAIASRGESATKGFLLGGMAWFAVPMAIASSLGLAARALEGNDPDMAILSASDVSAGLPAPAAAAALLGKSGAAMMLILLFLAVTSALAAQLVAVSSVITFDIFQPYIKPDATGKQLFLVSHAGVCIWAICCGVLGLIWFYIGVGLGWIYVMMGCVVGPSVFPVFACIAWSRVNKTAALVGTLTGEVCAIVAWLVSAATLEGELSIDTTNANNPLLAGNLIAVLLPVLIIVPWSLIAPDNYDWEGTRAINAPWTKTDSQTSSTQEDSSSQDEKVTSGTPPNEKATLAVAEKTAGEPSYNVEVEGYERLHLLRSAGLDPEKLLASRRMAYKAAIILTFILVIFIPCMTIIAETYTTAGLGVWISIVLGWLFVTGGIVVILPLWESREALGKMLKGFAKDLSGGKGKVTYVSG
jgi:SSS family transporter